MLEEYELLNEELEKKNEELVKENERLCNALNEVIERNSKAIDYIEKNSYTTIETIDDINYFIVRLDKCVDLLDILKGSE